MKPIIIMAIISGMLSLFGCGNKTKKSKDINQRAKQIEIAQLSEELKQLERNMSEYVFLALHLTGLIVFIL